MDILDKPLLLAGLATVSFMILAGTFMALTILTPVIVVLSPILVPAVFTLRLLGTGFLASGSLIASVMELLISLFMKEEHYNALYAREVKPVGTKKLSGRDKPAKKKKPAKAKKPLGVKKAEKGTSIPEISKVLLEEQKPICPKCYNPSTSTKRSHRIGFPMNSTKVRSTFMNEYQKVPRVGAFAYKYLTSRDKNT